MDNIELIMNAFEGCNARAELAKQAGDAGSPDGLVINQPFYELLANDVTWQNAVGEKTFRYGGELRGKQAVVELFESESQFLTDHGWLAPLEYFGNKTDRVVVLGKETYRIRKSGIKVERDLAYVFDFREGLISRILLIMDMSEWNATYQVSDDTQ